MIILDTNVVSELMKPAPSSQVLDWMRDQDQKDLAITVITLAEIYYGLGRLPEGRRREDLHRRFEMFIGKTHQPFCRVENDEHVSKRMIGLEPTTFSLGS